MTNPLPGIAIPLSMQAAGFTLGPINKAVKGLYGILGDINDYIDKHIEDMKRSANETIAIPDR